MFNMIPTAFRRNLKPVLLALLIVSAVLLTGCSDTPEFPDYTSAAPSTDTAYGKAAEALLNEYRTLLTVSEMDWSANGDAYEKQYPHVNRTYVGFYHLGLVNTLYAAFYDIDGNGTEEFFIGLGDRRDVMEVGVYAFNGSTMIPLSLTDTPDGYQLFADGTFLQSDGSGAVTAVKRIAEDGCTLEETENDILSLGDEPTEDDLAALGGHLYLSNWAKVTFEENRSADPFT